MNQDPVELASLLDHAETLAEVVQHTFPAESWQSRLAKEFIERVMTFREENN